MNTHPHVLNSSRPSRVTRLVPVIKWSTDLVLQAARERTRSITVTDSKGIQKMLADLMVESGWSEEDFIDALCEDVKRRHRQR